MPHEQQQQPESTNFFSVANGAVWGARSMWLVQMRPREPMTGMTLTSMTTPTISTTSAELFDVLLMPAASFIVVGRTVDQ